MICTPLTFALEMYNEVALKQDLGFKLLLTLFMYLYCPTEEADGADNHGDSIMVSQAELL